jgi:hypothetical protein
MLEVERAQQSIREWLERLFSAFRQQHASLSQVEQSKISNLDDLSSPCQIEVLWISKPEWNLDYQILVFTHFSDVADQDITIYGPVHPPEALDAMENIISQSKWQRMIDLKASFYFVATGDRRYAAILEVPFAHALRSIEGHTVRALYSREEKPIQIGEKSAISRDSFYWLVSGDIRNLDVDKIVKEIAKDTKVRAAAKPQPPKPKPARINGFATYFYPPIWIGELPPQTLRERLTGAKLASLMFPQKVLDAEHKNAKVVVNQGGLIAIGIEDRAKALDALNEIMAATLLSGVHSFAVRESELGKAEIDPQNLTIAGHNMPLISMRTKLEQQHVGLSPDLIPFERQVLSTDDIKKILRLAEELTVDPASSTVLLMLLEGYTHFHNAEYTQSFLMTWVVIEKWLDTLWEDLMKEKGIAGKRKQKLVESMLWTADTILETLNLVGKLSNDPYKQVAKLKKRRNTILHNGIRATKEEAEACINLASRLLTGEVV